jgi:hypothetical protein
MEPPRKAALEQAASLLWLLGLVYGVGWLTKNAQVVQWGVGPLQVAREAAIAAGICLLFISVPGIVLSQVLAGWVLNKLDHLDDDSPQTFRPFASFGAVIVFLSVVIAAFCYRNPLDPASISSFFLFNLYSLLIGFLLHYAIRAKSAHFDEKYDPPLSRSFFVTGAALLLIFILVTTSGKSPVQGFKPEFGGPLNQKVEVILRTDPRTFEWTLLDSDPDQAIFRTDNNATVRLSWSEIQSITKRDPASETARRL